jgi:hypothetical protein
MLNLGSVDGTVAEGPWQYGCRHVLVADPETRPQVAFWHCRLAVHAAPSSSSGEHTLPKHASAGPHISSPLQVLPSTTLAAQPVLTMQYCPAGQLPVVHEGATHLCDSQSVLSQK